ncbi:MAG: diguanylate cyclase [Archangium sp.]|nr:diguanylate cyclase [Archangium sp.]
MALILLVDDEKVARTLYADFLTGAGHQVVAVVSVAEARVALQRQHFDLVVTDLLMPETDGLELLQYVKITFPDIEVLVITALDKVEPAVRAIKSGASDYLVKPVSPEALSNATTRALTQHTLLRENVTLRRHVTLLEAGQRIATTLDRPHLLDAAGAAFATLCRASGAVLFDSEDGALRYAHMHGVDEADRAELERAVVEPSLRVVKAVDLHGHEIALALPPGYVTTYLVPVYEGSVLLGAVALLYKTALPDDAVSLAPYLARHFALGLKNQGRFSAIEDLAYLDDLTHLFNSRYLDLMLDKEFKNISAGSKPFALLFTDLDYFKSVNDTHGHVVGSKLLVEVGQVLKNCLRDNDVVCRWGGDEYVILLRGTDSGGALKVAERIRRSIESHRFLSREGFGLNISTCIGIASYPEHATDKATLLDFADRAMYRGKKGARNIIYMAAKGLEATPATRYQPYAPPEAK